MIYKLEKSNIVKLKWFHSTVRRWQYDPYQDIILTVVENLRQDWRWDRIDSSKKFISISSKQVRFIYNIRQVEDELSPI